MSKHKEDGEMFIVVASNLPSMLLNLLRSYLRMKRQAKVAGEEFYRSLVDGGVPPGMAKELRHDYASAFNITTMLKNMGPCGK
jgi:hypothetical protein